MECFPTYEEACKWAKAHCEPDTFDINEVYKENGECGYGVYDITMK
ncbi:MAG: hypothetical protein IKE94_09760 [Aeriscardovia sp.]|nr:hypothetical protein [Aeriscardovia sp.]